MKVTAFSTKKGKTSVTRAALLFLHTSMSYRKAAKPSYLLLCLTLCIMLLWLKVYEKNHKDKHLEKGGVFT